MYEEEREMLQGKEETEQPKKVGNASVFVFSTLAYIFLRPLGERPRKTKSLKVNWGWESAGPTEELALLLNTAPKKHHLITLDY